MNDFEANLAAVRARMDAATHAAGRPSGSVSLLAVSKGQNSTVIAAAWRAGQRAFGENYLQEALPHIDALPDAEWHFIGALQSNKSREIATRFDWVQSVDRVRLVQRLSEHRPHASPPLQVCIQVNVDDEAQKAGCAPSELPDLCAAVAESRGLRLRGLMVIPRPRDGFTDQRAVFAYARSLFEACRADGHDLDTLSMGMTADLEAAIAEGSTMVRIGTALFGARP